jgi:hypothetical protein
VRVCLLLILRVRHALAVVGKAHAVQQVLQCSSRTSAESDGCG